MPRLISLIDIYATATYNWSDVVNDDTFPTYDQMLTRPLEMSQSLPSSTTRAIANQKVSVEVNNLPASYGTGGLLYGVGADGSDSGYGDDPYGGAGPETLSEIATSEELLGKRARARLYDLDASATVWTVEGKITEIRRGVENGRLEIESVDLEAFQTPVPKKTIASVYASADLSGTNATDAPIIVAFGIMRKVPLVLCQSSAGVSYDYGAIRKPATGSFTINNIYRNGRIVGAGEYTLTESPTGYYVVRFTRAQTDGNSPMNIQADLTVTEFNSPANAIKFLINDSTYGLGKSVNATSFTAAASNYSTVQINVSNGLFAQRPAIDVLDDLLLHGAYLTKNNSGEYLLTVDMAALHPAATVSVGFGDGEWENLLPDSIEDDTPRSSEVVSTFILHGLPDPGFVGTGGEQYLITSTRTDATKEGRTETRHNPFLITSASLEREGHYRWHRLIRERNIISGKATMDASALQLGQLVPVHIPSMFHTGASREVRRLNWTASGSGSPVEASYPLELVEYDAAIFSFAAGQATTTTHAGATSLTDYFFTPPGTPTSFSVTGTTIRTSGDGVTEALVAVTATSPAANVTHLLFRAHRAGQTAYVSEIQVAIGTSAAGVAEFVLTPGLGFDLRVYAQNVDNDPTAQLSTAAAITSHTVAGDTTAPATVAGVAAAAGTGKNIAVTWTALSDATLSEYILYRGTSADPTAEYARARVNNFSDSNVSYGTTYHYRLKAIDYSGNTSAAYSSNVSAAVVKVDTGDVADDAIGTTQVDTLNASVITAGTISASVNMSANSINVAGSVLTVNSGGVTMAATGDSAMSISYGTFAKIKWYSGSAFGSEQHHIGAGDASGAPHYFKGMQLVSTDSTSSIRLGTGGAPFTNLGLVFTGDIEGSTVMYDGTSAPAAAAPDRRIKIVQMGNTGVVVGYIWCSTT